MLNFHQVRRLRIATPLREATSTATASNIYLESDGASNFFKIALPVQKAGKIEDTAFVVSGNETVSDLLTSIHREQLDTKQSDSYFLDNEGIRISGATSISSLILTNFKFFINQKNYSVESRIRTQDGSILTPVQLKTITEILNSQKEDTLALDAFLQGTTKAGINNSSAIQALKYLTRTGKFLYFSRDKELKNIIFLNPQTLAGTIEKSLLNEQFRLPLHEKILTVERLKKKLKELEEVRQMCVDKADRNAHLIAMSGFVFICGQFMVFARLTWWDSDWDVMEPITWFTQVNEMVIAAFAYYLFKGSEFGHYGFRNGLLAWQLKRQYAKHSFSEETYQDISCEIAELETQIKLVEDQNNYSKE